VPQKSQFVCFLWFVLTPIGNTEKKQDKKKTRQKKSINQSIMAQKQQEQEDLQVVLLSSEATGTQSVPVTTQRLDDTAHSMYLLQTQSLS
jgi:hypothetical protein